MRDARQYARWQIQESKWRKKSPSVHHRTTLWSYNFATTSCIDNRKKNLFNSNISTRPYSMMNFGPLTAEICWWVRGTPANCNWFRVLASLLHWRRSLEVNKTLQDVWASPRLVHYIYIFGGSCPLTDFCRLPAKFSLRPSLVFSYIASVTAWHSSSDHQLNFMAWYKEWNYRTFAEVPPIFGWVANWPSRWA